MVNDNLLKRKFLLMDYVFDLWSKVTVTHNYGRDYSWNSDINVYTVFCLIVPTLWQK